jgi:hypothetical protein
VLAQEKRARAFAIAVFVPVGIFAAAVGSHDAFAAVEVGSRFGGLLLLLTGAALLAAAVSLAVPALRWAPTAGIFVAPAGVLVGLGFMAAQLISVDRDQLSVWASILIALAVVTVAVHRVRSGGPDDWTPSLLAFALLAAAFLRFSYGEHDERVIVWAAIAIAPALVAYQLWLARPPDLSALSLRTVFGVFGLFSLGAVVSGAQLWYASQYVPAHQAPSLTVETKLRQLPGAAGLEAARLTLTVSNTSQTQARILSSVYRVGGSPLTPALYQSDADVSGQSRRPQVLGRPVLRYRRDVEWDLVQVGRVFPRGFWLDPDEKFSTSALVYIPRGRYDLLRSQVEVLIAKGGSLTVDDIEHPEVRQFAHVFGKPLWGVESRWGIAETSWFRELTRGDRSVGILWIAGRKGWPSQDIFPLVGSLVRRNGDDGSRREREDYSEQAEGLYGMAGTETVTEIPLRHAR